MLWGPWWGAMSLPALASWVAGGVSGMAGGLVLAVAIPMRLKIANAAVLGAFSVALVLGTQPFFTWLSGDQTLTVVFLKLEPRDEPLSIESEHVEPPSNDVLSLLRLANVRGHVTVKWAGSVHGRGPGAKALILLSGPLTNRVNLHQPDRATILYVQGADGFKTYPANARTLSRGIELSGGAAGVWYSVENADGGRQSGPAFSW
jgi:hypothetical protein